MKNKILKLSALSLAFAIIFSIFSVSAFAESNQRQYVYDPVYLLDDQQFSELNAKAVEISEKYGCAVHFVITDDPSINFNNIQQYSEDLYLDSAALGYGEGKDGVMLVLGTYDRCYWLLAYGEKGNFAFTDYCKDWMSERFLDNFGNDDWYGGFEQYILDCDYALEQAATGKPVDIYYEAEDIGVEGYAVAFVAGLLASLIICTIFKSQMKTANISTRAAGYVKRDEIIFTRKDQRFTHSTVTRTRIEENNDSSGGSSRGGTTVNSRGFSGKGGRF